MANEESAELSEPCVSSFDDPAAFVPPQFAAVLVVSVFAGDAVGDDEVDAAFLPSYPQRAGVLTMIRNPRSGLLSRPAFLPGNADFGERDVRDKVCSRILAETMFAAYNGFDTQWKALI